MELFFDNRNFPLFRTIDKLTWIEGIINYYLAAVALVVQPLDGVAPHELHNPRNQ